MSATLESLPDPAVSEESLRVVLALAEAILPGTDTIRAADERTVTDAMRLIEHVSPWATRLFKAGIGLLDRAAVVSTGRRFHRLGRQEQQTLLQKWELDPVLRAPLFGVAFALKFTHFDTQDIYESQGGRLSVVSSVEEPRWLSQIVVASEWEDEDELECEVVVVGTGAGGAVVGKELAERGYAVVFVEEGKHHQRDAFTGSSLQAHFDFYRGSLTVGNAPMPVFMGRMVGGSTAINTGSCFRTPRWVLDRWCEDIGTTAFEPDVMRPHFEKVERTLQVELAERKAVGPIADVMARGCDALGWDHRLMLRNAPGCEGDGFCDFGCATDARKSTNLSYIPPAAERGAMVFTGLRATRVMIEGRRAVGIEGVDEKGRTMRVRADAVVFCGGAIPTPMFLQRQGICNSSEQVGRNLSLHPSSGLSALMPERIDGHKHIPQGYFVDEFVREGILINAAQPDKNYAPLIFAVTGDRLMRAVEQVDHTASFGVLIADEGRGVVFPGPDGWPVVRYQMNKADVRKMHRGLSLAAKMSWAAGAKKLYPVVANFPEINNRAEQKRFDDIDLSASDLQLMSYHPLGSCKMGTDPKTSVVGLDHQTHDVERLYLVDGSTVPGPLGVNPQVTIMAMATRAAIGIADALG